MGRLRDIVVDSLDPPRLARFWAQALDDYEIRAYDEAELARLAERGLTPETDPSVAVDGPGPTLWFQKTERSKTERNRVHLDIASADPDAEIQRLLALGATVRDRHAEHTVMLDPEGNEFCLRALGAAAPRPRQPLGRTARGCGIAAVLLAFVVPVVGGWLQPGYDHSAQFISELGAVGAEHARLINLAGFLPIGALTAAFVLLGWRSLALSPLAALGCLLFLGVAGGYLVAAFAPCDPGCPLDGSPRQALHDLTGLAHYLGGGSGLLLLGTALWRHLELRDFGATTMLVGAVVLVMFYLLAAEPNAAMRGAWQRLLEAALFGWVAMTALGYPDPPSSPEPSSE